MATQWQPPNGIVQRQDAVIHGPNAKPEEPPVGMIVENKERGYKEQWDGLNWVIYRPAKL